MPTVSASEVVVASAEEAFEFIADYRNIPRLQPHFVTAKLVGDVDRQVGAQVDLDGRFHGIPMRARNRIIGYDPPTRLVSVSEGTVLSRSTWELQQVSDNPATTRVTLTVDYKLRSSLGGLFMGSALWSLFNREVQGMTDESLHRLGRFFDGKTGS